MIRQYRTAYNHKQAALYALVLYEILDGNFADLLQFSIGSIHSEGTAGNET